MTHRNVSLNDGYTIISPEIRTTIEDDLAIVSVNGSEASVVIALGYVLDPKGVPIGVDLSEPAILMSAPVDVDRSYQHESKNIAKMLRALADSIEANDTLATLEDRGTFAPNFPEPGQ